MSRRQKTVQEELQPLQALANEPAGLLFLAEQMLRIRDREGRMVALRANPAQRQFERRRGRQNIVLKARQMGMTTWMAGRFFLKSAFTPGSMTLLVAHQREAAESMFAIVRRMWEALPAALREDELRLCRSNAGEMEFATTGSAFRVASAADVNAGRGLSVQYLHCSEVSRWPGDAHATLAGLRASLAPRGELVLESTPSGAYGAFYDAWCSAVETREQETGIRWPEDALVRHFFPWWLEPAYRGVAVAEPDLRAEEQQLMARHGISAEQIGFRRELERSFGGLRSQEFAEDAQSCFRATGTCCFEVDVVEQRMREVGEAREQRRSGALQVWLRALPGRQYVLGVDTAGGGSEGDFAAVQVVDVETGMQCAELQERLRPTELAEVCAVLAEEYGQALIAVERNNHGAAVLALLGLRPGLRLYEQHGQAGWLTHAASRPEMLARLGTLLARTPERFLSRRLLGECRTFVSDAQGRTAASAGAHDDLLMAMAVAQAVRAEVLEQGGRKLEGGCV